MIKLFIPASNEYLETTESEAKEIKNNLTDQGFVCWIVYVNNPN